MRKKPKNMKLFQCCAACGLGMDSEDHEYCGACTTKHNLGKESMERLDEELRNINLACKLCLEDVLQWLKTGKVDGVGFDEQQVIEVIEGTLSGKYKPDSFLSGDEIRIGE